MNQGRRSSWKGRWWSKSDPRDVLKECQYRREVTVAYPNATATLTRALPMDFGQRGFDW